MICNPQQRESDTTETRLVFIVTQISQILHSTLNAHLLTLNSQLHSWQIEISVAADLQSDANYYKDLQS